jgi:NAD(P)-dependent dehydrogenase (short-subunit alcohol dehydrogenase family)
MPALSGKTAIVTGAASGIGQGVALRVASEGANVACFDLYSSSDTLEQIGASGGTAAAWQIDVGLAPSWPQAVGEVVARWGGVELLANVAGITPGAIPGTSDSVLNLTEDIWDQVIRTNLKSVWLAMKNVIPYMQRGGGGRIVNTTSMAALRGSPGVAAYASSKGGIIALTQQAAAEYTKDDILINAVAPGMILTPAKMGNEGMFQARAAEVQLIGRLGKPSEVASMFTYLFSEGTFLTGQTFAVDGGWTIRI